MAQMDDSCKVVPVPAYHPESRAGRGGVAGVAGAVNFFAGIKARTMTAIARTRRRILKPRLKPFKAPLNPSRIIGRKLTSARMR